MFGFDVRINRRLGSLYVASPSDLIYDRSSKYDRSSVARLCGDLPDADGLSVAALVEPVVPGDVRASTPCQFVSSSFSARVTRSRAPRCASNCNSASVRFAPVPFLSARRYLCAIVDAVAWPDAEPTDACSAPTSMISNSFDDPAFIPAPSNPRLGGYLLLRVTARKWNFTYAKSAPAPPRPMSHHRIDDRKAEWCGWMHGSPSLQRAPACPRF